MFDYGALLLAPLYSFLGVEASITLTDTGNTVLDVTVIDKTAGIIVGNNVQTGTLDIGAVVRFSEIDDGGFSLADLVDAEITFSDNTWRIFDAKPIPVPSGEKNGEILLLLVAS